MDLPEELEHDFWQELWAYEEETQMAYVSSVERIGYQRGAVQATREAVLELLEVRFGGISARISAVLTQTDDLSRLKVLLRQAATVNSLDAFEMLLA